MKYLTHRRKIIAEACTEYKFTGGEIPVTDDVTLTNKPREEFVSRNNREVIGDVQVVITVSACGITPNPNEKVMGDLSAGIGITGSVDAHENAKEVLGDLSDMPEASGFLKMESAETVIELIDTEQIENTIVDGSCSLLSYLMEDNDAGGETYNITESNYTVDGGTVTIMMGGPYGSE